MYAPIKENPYEEASIKGFKRYQPYIKLLSPKALIITPEGCNFSSLAKLNDELFEWEPGEADRVLSYESLYSSYEAYNADVKHIPPVWCSFHAAWIPDHLALTPVVVAIPF